MSSKPLHSTTTLPLTEVSTDSVVHHLDPTFRPSNGSTVEEMIRAVAAHGSTLTHLQAMRPYEWGPPCDIDASVLDATAIFRDGSSISLSSQGRRLKEVASKYDITLDLLKNPMSSAKGRE